MTVMIKNIGLRFTDQLDVDVPGIRGEWEKALEKQSR